jgi:hypothetical protein
MRSAPKPICIVTELIPVRTVVVADLGRNHSFLSKLVYDAQRRSVSFLWGTR